MAEGTDTSYTAVLSRVEARLDRIDDKLDKYRDATALKFDTLDAKVDVIKSEQDVLKGELRGSVGMVKWLGPAGITALIAGLLKATGVL